MRKLLVCLGLGLALMTAPAVAAVNLGLPINTPVNFDGNGVFDQSSVPGFEMIDLGSGVALYPRPATFPPDGAVTELFGAGSISGVADLSVPGNPTLWQPSDEGPNFEMTFVFWDAVVTGSSRTAFQNDGDATLEALLWASYTDGARLLLVQDTTAGDATAFDSSPGIGNFDLVDGEYPTAYTLEDAGYDTDGAADGLSMFNVADDAGEEVFLDLALSGNTSRLYWDPDTSSFTSGDFKSLSVEILGGTGASQFSDFLGGDGSAAALIITFPVTGWQFAGDVDIQLTTVPEPATLVFLGTGLVSLLGYRIRRKMS